MNSELIFEQLKYSLQALALTSDQQLALFPDFVHKVDELALDFDHWYRCVLQFQDQLTDEQRQTLQRIDRALDDLTADKQGWSEVALHNHPEWENVRRLAREALALFRWPLQVPPSDRSHYVRG